MNKYLIILALYVLVLPSNVLADEPILSDVFLGDIHNIAIGPFNLKQNKYLFSIPKDWPPTDRGQIWGLLFIFEDKGKKHPYLEFFDCGPHTSHAKAYKIDFSGDDKYLVIVTGQEGVSAIDVFRVSDLIEPQAEDWNGKGWTGTDQCVEPMATVGSYHMPVAFHGWNGNVPLVWSAAPLNQNLTSNDVRELKKQGLCCDGAQQMFAWDISTDQFTLVIAP